MSTHSFAISVSGTLCAVLIAAGPAQAQSRPTAAERGHATFRQLCAVCHGERGNAKGAAAGALKPPATDLQRLTKRYGQFPAAHLRAVVTGRDESAAHTPAMQTWGPMLLAQANGDEAAAGRLVDDLLAFIESIQVK